MPTVRQLRPVGWRRNSVRSKLDEKITFRPYESLNPHHRDCR